MEERPERTAVGVRKITAADIPHDAFALMPDLATLQQAAYESLPEHAASEAMEHDAAYPLWSSTHRYVPLKRQLDPEAPGGSWMVDWLGTRDLYMYSALTMRDIALHSSIPLRRIEHASGKYNWVQARRTHALISENAARAPRLSELEDKVRRKFIEDMLTDAGNEMLRHALAALQQNPDQISPRDVAALAKTAKELISMGQKMPANITHSTVDNPNQGQQAGAINILQITDSETANVYLAEILERAQRLGIESAGKVVEATSSPRGAPDGSPGAT